MVVWIYIVNIRKTNEMKEYSVQKGTLCKFISSFIFPIKFHSLELHIKRLCKHISRIICEGVIPISTQAYDIKIMNSNTDPLHTIGSNTKMHKLNAILYVFLVKSLV